MGLSTHVLDTMNGCPAAGMAVELFSTEGDKATLIKHIRKIDLSLNSSFTEYGFFGGVSIDFYQMGFQTGFLATKLLKGGAIKDIPIEDARRSIVAVNRKRMQDLGIRLSPEARSIVDKWID